MGYNGHQLLGNLHEAGWIHLIEALWALECRHLLGEVSMPDYRQQRGILLAGCQREAGAESRYLKRVFYGEDAA